MSNIFNTRTSHECSQDEVGEITLYLMSKFPAIKRIAIVVEEYEHEEVIVSGALAMADKDHTVALKSLLLKAIDHVQGELTVNGVANRITGEVIINRKPRGN